MAFVDTMDFNSTGPSSICVVSSKNKPSICSHYNIAGHTANKCYKLHRYPLSYKSRMNTVGNKSSSSSQPAIANQVSSSSSISQTAIANQMSTSSSVSPVAALSASQCQQLIDFLHS